LKAAENIRTLEEKNEKDREDRRSDHERDDPDKYARRERLH